MSRNAIQITNSALIKLGASPISTFTDGGNATTMRSEFPAIRNLLLSEHVWHFASELVTPAALNETVPGDWTYAFAIPPDCARITAFDVSGEVHPYEIRSGKIYYDFSTPTLRYVKNFPADATEDAVLYPDSFAYALTCRLAAHVGVNITQNTKLSGDLMQEYMLAVGQARFSGACERFDQVTRAQEWLDSRHGSLGDVDIGARHTAP
tara:strand:- start:440 stop:1063 length:624 start_codon:yes stop_codon:yes gene_type:complete